MSHLSLHELRFQQRAFQHYYDHLIKLRNLGEKETLSRISLDPEIIKLEHRMNDLAVLIQRRKVEEEEFPINID